VKHGVPRPSAVIKGLADLAMRLDNRLRTTVLKLTGEKLYRNPHLYERNGD